MTTEYTDGCYEENYSSQELYVSAMRSENTERVKDKIFSNIKAGSPVYVYEKGNNFNQTWKVTSVSEGLVTLKSKKGVLLYGDTKGNFLGKTNKNFPNLKWMPILDITLDSYTHTLQVQGCVTGTTKDAN